MRIHGDRRRRRDARSEGEIRPSFIITQTTYMYYRHRQYVKTYKQKKALFELL